MGVRFGEFVFEPESRRLLRDGRELRLGRKAFELLEFLVDRRPRALSKAQIRDRLWPRTFVSESSLGTVVSELRRALGDGARQPRYIRTVYGFGYAFCGETAGGLLGSDAQRAPTRLIWERREFPLAEGENVLGRDETAAARIEAPTVSRQHARIVVRDGEATLQDLSSKNGTFLRGERLQAPQPLRDGDEIGLGRIRLIFRVRRASVSTQSEAPRT